MKFQQRTMATDSLLEIVLVAVTRRRQKVVYSGKNRSGRRKVKILFNY